MQFELVSQYATFASESLSNDGLDLFDLAIRLKACPAPLETSRGLANGWQSALSRRGHRAGRYFPYGSETQPRRRRYLEIDFSDSETNDPMTIAALFARDLSTKPLISPVKGIASSDGLCGLRKQC